MTRRTRVSALRRPHSTSSRREKLATTSGGTGAPYTLTITCFDWTTGNLADPAMNPTIPAQTFDGNAAAVLWTKSGTNFLTQQVFRIPATGNLPGAVKGHLFVYTVSLVIQNFNIVSTAQSNLFLIV
jgi:hypothetical protein